MNADKLRASIKYKAFFTIQKNASQDVRSTQIVMEDRVLAKLASVVYPVLNKFLEKYD